MGLVVSPEFYTRTAVATALIQGDAAARGGEGGGRPDCEVSRRAGAMHKNTENASPSPSAAAGAQVRSQHEPLPRFSSVAD